MGEELTIYAKILATLSGQGFTQAEAGLGKTEKAAKGAAAGMIQAESAGKQLGRTLQQYLGVAVLGNLVKTSVVEFAKYERSLSAIGKQIETLGGNAGDSLPQVRAFLETLERTSGTARQDLVPSFQKFLGITGSVEGAMYAVALASDLVEANLGDMGSVSEKLAGILAGRVGPAALGLGLNQRKANGELKTSADLITELNEKYGGFGATQKDAADKLDQINASWNDFKQTLANGVAPALSLVTSVLAPVVKIIQSIGPALIFVGNAAGALLGSLAESIPKFFNFKTLFTEGGAAWADGMKTAFRTAMDRFAAEEGGLDELKAIWREQGEAQGQAMANGQADALAVARRKQAELEADERRKADKKAAEEAAKAAAEEAKAKRDALIETAKFQQDLAERFQEMAAEEAEDAARNVEEQAENERNAMLGLLDEEIAILEEHDARRLELQALRLELEMQAELEAANLTEEAKAKIRGKFQARMAELEKRHSNARKKLETEEALNTKQLQLSLARDAVGLLSTVFGKHKAFAIAEAIIDTWMAVNNALASVPYPYNIVAAALIAAQGLANVHKIRTTDISQGGGFDDPVHDRLARAGGRRWAVDVLRNLDMGFRDGFAAAARSSDAGAASGGGSTTTNDNRMTVNFGHVMGGRAEARRIARILDRARERDLGRTVR